MWAAKPPKPDRVGLQKPAGVTALTFVGGPSPLAAAPGAAGCGGGAVAGGAEPSQPLLLASGHQHGKPP